MVTIGMNPTREECLFPGGFPTKENIMTTNRRAFLQSAGALLAGAGLARSVSAMPTERPEKFDESFDVVVLGAGGAGLTAAIRLAEGGKKVLLAEKLAFCGGSSLICGGGVAVTETDLQKKAGIKDSVETLYEDIMRTGGQLCDKDVVRAYAEASPDYYVWAMKHGMVLNTERLSQSGSVPRNLSVNTQKSIDAWTQLAKKLGVDLRTGTKGEKLLYDGKAKRICGVQLSSKAGVRNVEAKDGVVIATGGFARNKALLEKYVPRMKNASTICAMGCDGDGLKMALAYGADVADMPYIKATFRRRASRTPAGSSATARSFSTRKGSASATKKSRRRTSATTCSISPTPSPSTSTTTRSAPTRSAWTRRAEASPTPKRRDSS